MKKLTHADYLALLAKPLEEANLDTIMETHVALGVYLQAQHDDTFRAQGRLRLTLEALEASKATERRATYRESETATRQAVLADADVQRLKLELFDLVAAHENAKSLTKLYAERGAMLKALLYSANRLQTAMQERNLEALRAKFRK